MNEQPICLSICDQSPYQRGRCELKPNLCYASLWPFMGRSAGGHEFYAGYINFPPTIMPTIVV